VRVTHRFHPLFGRDFEFVAHRQNWFQYSVIVPDLRRYGWADGLSCGLFIPVDQPAESPTTAYPRRSRGATEAA
jgi:hypothetical protein